LRGSGKSVFPRREEKRERGYIFTIKERGKRLLLPAGLLFFFNSAKGLVGLEKNQPTQPKKGGRDAGAVARSKGKEVNIPPVPGP